MAEIIIRELYPNKSDSFFIEVADMSYIPVYGGNGYALDYAFHQILNFTYSLVDLMLSAFAIYSIVSLAYSFITATEVEIIPDQVAPF
ncbi:hypothetical protein NWP21_11805 [Anabaenopsis sp. FSS-46]|uniref:hypothetical protein n=1 Tax=Anabaenopsis sp. FSS-46 TaxID=2971766 RepID=UPI002476E99D|nr:hypothetical protein [Anabaenopsis sp. FSS-46]MDH6099512.1 hypothetical protein [Anabaenopsis sp. FSS-46]